MIMKIKTEKKALQGALSQAFRAVPAKAVQPILETFLFSASDGLLTVTATDANIVVQTSLECECEGSACIPARLILDIVKAAPDGDITITSEGATAEVDWGKGKATIPAQDTEDFPDISPAPSNGVRVPFGTLYSAIKHVLPHVSDDPIRPALNGIYFNPSETGWDLVASDSRTLCVYPVEAEGEKPDFIIPSQAAAIIADAVKVDGTAIFTTDDNAIYCDMGGFTLRVRKIVGKFPDYKRIIPTAHGSLMTIGRETLIKSLTRISVCANKSTQHVKVDINALGAVLESQDLGFSVSARESVDASLEGEELTIGFRSDLLIKTLAGLSSENVGIAFNGPKKAALVSAEDDPCQVVIMPVMIQ